MLVCVVVCYILIWLLEEFICISSSVGGSVTFGPLWPDYTFHLKAQRTKPAMLGSQTDLLLTEELHNTAKICTCIYTKESMYEAGHSSVGWPPA